MDIAAALAADLALLDELLDDPAATVADTVLLLAADARSAVRSFLGLTVSVANAGRTGTAINRVTLRFTLLEDHVDPRDIQSSLRLPRTTIGAAPDEPRIAIVLYAGTPGAFVDMAADLSFLAGGELDAGSLDQDRELASEDDITGVLRSESLIHEAMGVLIAGGRTAEQAETELDTLAEAAHTDRTTAAADILDALADRGPDLLTREIPGVDGT